MSDGGRRTGPEKSEGVKRKASDRDRDSDSEPSGCPICAPITTLNIEVEIVVTSASVMEELWQPRQHIIRVGERGPRGRGRGQPRAAARTAEEVVPPEPTDPEDAQVAVPCQIPGAPTLTTSSDPTYSGSNIARELRPTWSLAYTFEEVSREQNTRSMEMDSFAYLLQAAEIEFPLDSEMEEGKGDPVLPQLNESNEQCFTPVKTATTAENRDISLPSCKEEDKGKTQADSDHVSEVCSDKVEDECDICTLMKSLHQLSIQDLDSEPESPMKSSGVSKEFQILQYCDALPPASQSNNNVTLPVSDAGSSNDMQEVSQHQGENLPPAASTQANALPTVPHASVQPRDVGAGDLPVTLTVDDFLNDPDTRIIRLENPQVLDLIYRNTASITELLEYRVNGMLGLLADVALTRRSQENQSTSSPDKQNTSAQENQSTSSQENQSTSSQDDQNTSAQDNPSTSSQDNQSTSSQESQSTSS